VVNQQVTVLIT